MRLLCGGGQAGSAVNSASSSSSRPLSALQKSLENSQSTLEGVENGHLHGGAVEMNSRLSVKNQKVFPSLMLIRRHSECHAELFVRRKHHSFPVASVSFNFICLFEPDYTPKGVGLAVSFIENIIFSLKEFSKFKEIIHCWFYPVALKLLLLIFKQKGFGDIVVIMTGQLAA